jgi:hypothetical protein
MLPTREAFLLRRRDNDAILYQRCGTIVVEGEIPKIFIEDTRKTN